MAPTLSTTVTGFTSTVVRQAKMPSSVPRPPGSALPASPSTSKVAPPWRAPWSSRFSHSREQPGKAASLMSLAADVTLSPEERLCTCSVAKQVSRRPLVSRTSTKVRCGRNVSGSPFPGAAVGAKLLVSRQPAELPLGLSWVPSQTVACQKPARMLLFSASALSAEPPQRNCWFTCTTSQFVRPSVSTEGKPPQLGMLPSGSVPAAMHRVALPKPSTANTSKIEISGWVVPPP